MTDFRSIAQKVTTLCPLMEGREKGCTEDLIDGENHVIDAIYFCPEIDKGVWVYTVQDDDSRFYFAGYVLNKIFSEYLKAMSGDYEVLYDEFASFGGLLVRFEEGETSKGRSITNVKVL